MGNQNPICSGTLSPLNLDLRLCEVRETHTYRFPSRVFSQCPRTVIFVYMCLRFPTRVFPSTFLGALVDEVEDIWTLVRDLTSIRRLASSLYSAIRFRIRIRRRFSRDPGSVRTPCPLVSLRVGGKVPLGTPLSPEVSLLPTHPRCSLEHLEQSLPTWVSKGTRTLSFSPPTPQDLKTCGSHLSSSSC